MKTHHNHSNHMRHKHSDHTSMIKDYKRRFVISVLLTIPVLILSPMIQKWFGFGVSVSYNYNLLGVLSSGIFLFGGWPFFKGFYAEVKRMNIGMMTLISIAISAAYFYSIAVVFGFEGKTFFWELATLIDVMLVGHLLEMKSVLGASQALKSLAELMPKQAHLVVDGKERSVSVSYLKKDDVIAVKPGEKVPVDGIVLTGTSELDESFLTGESQPIRKAENDKVIGGALNGNGALHVRVDKIGVDTYLSKVIGLVESAQKQKSKTQRLADVAAKWLTVIALTMGITTCIVWILKGAELSFAIERMVTVMVICCPHALGLAVPLVAAISTSISAKQGILIRNRTAFENSRKISTVVFDKTGTLTKGNHVLQSVKSFDQNYSQEEIVMLATSVEINSEHHISKGLLRYTDQNNLVVPIATEFEYEAGIGVSGRVSNKLVKVGGALLLNKLSISRPSFEDEMPGTEVFVIIDGELAGYITFADQIRETSFAAIKALQETNIACVLLTGDNENVAKVVADKLHMDEYKFGVLPDEKQDYIKQLQSKGNFVAMTGDGVNDAPALAQADVGIAIGSGTDIAAETADIVLVDSNPSDISNLILFGKSTYRKMVQNIIWATCYNVVALPLATGFIPGLVISPAFGAALMAISTIICAANAQLLKREFITP